MDNLRQPASRPIQFKKTNNDNNNRKENHKGFEFSNSEKPLSAMMQPTNLIDNHHQLRVQIFEPACSPGNQQQRQQQQHQVVELKTKVKKPKLLSSKSLSRLVPRNLFFKKGSTNSSSINNVKNNNNANEDNNGNKLATTKSLPSMALRSQQQQASLNSNATNRQPSENPETPVSLIVLPRQSTSNLFAKVESSTPFSKLNQPFSPIHGAAEQLNRVNLGEPYSFFSAATDSGFDSGCSAGQSVQSAFENQAKPPTPPTSKTTTKEASECGQEKRRKYKSTLKNTTLVLRDVKNSIGLRIKARQESQAFAKLTDELASPPTKLYSPFNIYANDSATKPKKEPTKSKRKLNLANSKQVSKVAVDQSSSMMSVDDEVSSELGETATPKHRVVSQHRRHLLQANRFTFDSPAGRLRETVKDVEHFQQCIEDISKAIRSRDRSL